MKVELECIICTQIFLFIFLRIQVLDNGCNRTEAAMDRPVILIKRLFTKLMDGVESFLVNNQNVKSLVLEALPIQGIHMATLINVGIFVKHFFLIHIAQIQL